MTVLELDSSMSGCCSSASSGRRIEGWSRARRTVERCGSSPARLDALRFRLRRGCAGVRKKSVLDERRAAPAETRHQHEGEHRERGEKKQVGDGARDEAVQSPSPRISARRKLASSESPSTKPSSSGAASKPSFARPQPTTPNAGHEIDVVRQPVHRVEADAAEEQDRRDRAGGRAPAAARPRARSAAG